jgi:hypothetical protein
MGEAGVPHGAKQREAAPQSARAFCGPVWTLGPFWHWHLQGEWQGRLVFALHIHSQKFWVPAPAPAPWPARTLSIRWLFFSFSSRASSQQSTTRAVLSFLLSLSLWLSAEYKPKKKIEYRIACRIGAIYTHPDSHHEKKSTVFAVFVGCSHGFARRPWSCSLS